MPKVPKTVAVDTLYGTFIASFASQKWQSIRVRSHWVDLEGWQDSIVGPLSSIAEAGGCKDVYNRTDGYFTGVADPDTLLRFLLDCHERLVAGFNAFYPANPAELEDCRYRIKLADEMRALIQNGGEMERVRWATSNVPTNR